MIVPMNPERSAHNLAIAEQPLTFEVRPHDSQHIFAKDFSDRLVAVPETRANYSAAASGYPYLFL